MVNMTQFRTNFAIRDATRGVVCLHPLHFQSPVPDLSCLCHRSMMSLMSLMSVILELFDLLVIVSPDLVTLGSMAKSGVLDLDRK